MRNERLFIRHRKWVYNIMASIYDQKSATEMYGKEQYVDVSQKEFTKLAGLYLKKFIMILINISLQYLT